MGESFKQELESLINKHSLENYSGTPDFILAWYMLGCLRNFEDAINKREDWYGREQDETFGVPKRSTMLVHLAAGPDQPGHVHEDCCK